MDQLPETLQGGGALVEEDRETGELAAEVAHHGAAPGVLVPQLPRLAGPGRRHEHDDGLAVLRHDDWIASRA